MGRAGRTLPSGVALCGTGEIARFGRLANVIGSILGNSVRRVEDPRFLGGTATYVEDLSNDEALHAAFVRSFLAHSRITAIDDTSAKALPGVAAVCTPPRLDLPPMPPLSVVRARL